MAGQRKQLGVLERKNWQKHQDLTKRAVLFLYCVLEAGQPHSIMTFAGKGGGCNRVWTKIINPRNSEG